jgi:hypothetical protein
VIAELDRRIDELRFRDGVEKVEHVPYQSGDQFWVRFNRPLDLVKLDDIIKKHGYCTVPFAGLPSKLPRGLSELLWDGVTHVITKKISGWSNLISKVGFEPEGIAKLAVDLHGPYWIFIATNEEGIQLLYEYLGAKYVPPAPPPPKPVAPTTAKPLQPATPKPTPPAGLPAAPAQPTQTKTVFQQTVLQTGTGSPAPSRTPAQEQAKKETPGQAAT